MRTRFRRRLWNCEKARLDGKNEPICPATDPAKTALIPYESADRGGNLGGCVSKRRIRSVNAALRKTCTVHSGVRVMLRAVAINLTNAPQFAEPNSVLVTTGPFVAAPR